MKFGGPGDYGDFDEEEEKRLNSSSSKMQSKSDDHEYRPGFAGPNGPRGGARPTDKLQQDQLHADRYEHTIPKETSKQAGKREELITDSKQIKADEAAAKVKTGDDLTANNKLEKKIPSEGAMELKDKFRQDQLQRQEKYNKPKEQASGQQQQAEQKDQQQGQTAREKLEQKAEQSQGASSLRDRFRQEHSERQQRGQEIDKKFEQAKSQQAGDKPNLREELANHKAERKEGQQQQADQNKTIVQQLQDRPDGIVKTDRATGNQYQLSKDRSEFLTRDKGGNISREKTEDAHKRQAEEMSNKAKETQQQGMRR